MLRQFPSAPTPELPPVTDKYYGSKDALEEFWEKQQRERTRDVVGCAFISLLTGLGLTGIGYAAITHIDEIKAFFEAVQF